MKTLGSLSASLIGATEAALLVLLRNPGGVIADCGALFTRATLA